MPRGAPIKVPPCAQRRFAEALPRRRKAAAAAVGVGEAGGWGGWERRRRRPGRRGERRSLREGRAGRSLAGPERPPRWGGDSGTDPEEMEGEGAPSWRGGPGGLIRELCRSFGHYNRHLARLQHNLRETKKFFRDVKYSQGNLFASGAAIGEGSPSGAGGGGTRDGGERGRAAAGPARAGRPRPGALWRGGCGAWWGGLWVVWGWLVGWAVG